MAIAGPPANPLANPPPANPLAGPLPVTVVGGYLGAGKTTLVNSLLRQANGRRLAIMVNEFGALPIDSSLIEAADDRIVSLAGGCVCCSYGEDFVSSLVMLAALEPRPDHILLEASGVAFPGAIAGTIGLLTGFALDGVVVLADAETVRRRAADRYIGSTVRQQLAQADLILLNKCDLAVDPDAVEAWLGATAPTERIVRATQADAPIDVVLGMQTDRDTLASGGSPVRPYRRLYRCCTRSAGRRRPGACRPNSGRSGAPPVAGERLRPPAGWQHGRDPGGRQPVGGFGCGCRGAGRSRLYRPQRAGRCRRDPARGHTPLSGPCGAI